MPFDAPRLRDLAHQLVTRKRRRVLNYATPKRGRTWRERIDLLGGPWCLLLFVAGIATVLLWLLFGERRSFLPLISALMIASALALRKRYEPY